MSTRLLPNRVSPTPGMPSSQAPKVPEPQVLAAEVVVRSPEGELSEKNCKMKSTGQFPAPGRTVCSQLQEDINDLCDGLFSDVRPNRGYPFGRAGNLWCSPTVLRDVKVQANAGINVPSVLPERVVDEIFQEQYGILNLRRFQSGIQRLNKWYQDNGYVLLGNRRPQDDGTVNLSVAEGW